MKNKENNLIIFDSILDDVKNVIKKAKDKKIIRPCADAFKNNPVELENPLIFCKKNKIN